MTFICVSVIEITISLFSFLYSHLGHTLIRLDFRIMNIKQTKGKIPKFRFYFKYLVFDFVERFLALDI